MATTYPISTHHRFRNLLGQTFGRLYVASYAGPNAITGRADWNCECVCGEKTTVQSWSLVKGLTKSCGCLAAEVTSDRSSTHRLTGSPEHRVWCAMIQRCRNPRSKGFARYGGRGISVCERWGSSFETFLADMGQRPSLQYSLDRYPDNNGNYEPSNCRWATQREQGMNRRDNHHVTWRGETKTISEWARVTNISTSTLWNRLSRGIPLSKVFASRHLRNTKLSPKFISTIKREYASGISMERLAANHLVCAATIHKAVHFTSSPAKA